MSLSMKAHLNLEELAATIRSFTAERDWDQFHSPKNLAASLSIESAELLEIFQWIKEQDSHQIMQNPEKASQVKDELADVFYYLIRMADILEVDLESALKSKMHQNAEKYPVARSKGNAKKYTDFK